MGKYRLKVIYILLMSFIFYTHLPVVHAQTTTADEELHVIVNSSELSTKPLINEGAILVPVRSLLDALGASLVWNRENRTISAKLNDQSIKLSIGSTNALVNEQKVLLDQAPLIKDGTTFVPLRFIGESFGQVVLWNAKTHTATITTQEQLIFNDDATNFLTKESVTIQKPINVPTATPVGNRRFMISDQPETLNENTITTTKATLWSDEVETEDPSVNHHIFGWHVNKFDNPVLIGLTIENLSTKNDLDINDIRELNKINKQTYDVGLPLAEMSLSDQYTSRTNITVEKATTKTIALYDVRASDLIGFINEFTVKRKGDGKLHYRVRIVMSRLANRNLTTIKSDPVQLDDLSSHSRGTWGFSSIQATFPTYSVTDHEKSYSISNGVTDNFMSKATSINQNADSKSNIGHFGASYTVVIPIENKTEQPKTVRLRLGSRGGLYSGAIKTKWCLSC